MGCFEMKKIEIAKCPHKKFKGIACKDDSHKYYDCHKCKFFDKRKSQKKEEECEKPLKETTHSFSVLVE